MKHSFMSKLLTLAQAFEAKYAENPFLSQEMNDPKWEMERQLRSLHTDLKMLNKQAEKIFSAEYLKHLSDRPELLAGLASIRKEIFEAYRSMMKLEKQLL